MGMPTGNRAVTHQGKMYINSQSYVEHENIFTQSDAELLALAEDEGWEGTGTVEDPIIISGYSFYAEPTQPVRIWNTDLHWVFANNLVRTSGVMCGFYLTQTTAGIIRENVFQGCHSAIAMINCGNIIIENNTFLSNIGNGVDQEAALTNATIRYNEFWNHGADAISLEDTNSVDIYGNYINGAQYDGIDTQNGHDILIEDNIILGTRMGIRIGRRSTDIHVVDNLVRNITHHGINCNGDSNLIENNVLRDIGINGIIFSGSEGLNAEENVVTSNTFINCTSYAIQIEEVVINTVITSNDFFETGQECHICDSSNDATIESNFYDTWTSPDVNGDSIVDNPYEIAGSIGNMDASPKASPINQLPTDYEYTPIVTVQDELPLFELALISGIGITVCLIVVIMIKRR